MAESRSTALLSSLKDFKIVSQTPRLPPRCLYPIERNRDYNKQLRMRRDGYRHQRRTQAKRTPFLAFAVAGATDAGSTGTGRELSFFALFRAETTARAAA